MTTPQQDNTANMSAPIVVWFRNDLRLADNPALTFAAEQRAPIIGLYVLDEISAGVRPLGGAARWWLHHSLEQFRAALAKRGIPLILRRGASFDHVLQVAADSKARCVLWNRRYSASEITIDKSVKDVLPTMGVAVESFNGSLLNEPWVVKTKSGGAPIKVFTPYWRAARALGDVSAPLPVPEFLAKHGLTVESDRLDDWGLLPTSPDWSAGLSQTWTPGEEGASERLEEFLEHTLPAYARDRDRPDRLGTSMLSPHLRFGEMSPRQIWQASAGRGAGSSKFLSEIGWREFSYHLLYFNPDLAEGNFNSRFDNFPWADSAPALRAWQRGETGYPIVDAGMRQLWTTGWMHNRVRMVTASFLVKHLLIDWRHGERWFWDTLVDADPANNAASWQWVAGSGADAAPYFRIFNPILQGEKFDPNGDYVRQWVPELTGLSPKRIHKPWEASEAELSDAGIRLGTTYPRPIVDHGFARTRALAAYQSIKEVA